MIIERNALPIDPFQPLELEDGTPVKLVEFVRRYGTREPLMGIDLPMGNPLGYTGTWWFQVSTGLFDGHYPGQSTRVRNVGTALPPGWKERAAYEVKALPSEAQVPWSDAEELAVEHHFPRLELVDGVPMVAFFQTEKHGEAGRLTKMRPGRYLTRFFGDKLTNDDVESYAAAVTVQAGAMDVRWTQDADEIEEIYVNGPRSCMSGRASSYDGCCHPARVYAGPDLAVAWLGDQDDASARAIVWPEKKIFGGVYGDVSRMTMLLESKGFREGYSSDFAGARLRRYEDCDGIVLPYLDIAGSADDAGDYIVIGRGGDLETGNTNGLGGHSRVCDRCGDSMGEDESTYVENVEESWCEHCVSNYATYCDYAYETVSGDSVEVHSTSRNYTRTCAERHLDRFDIVHVPGRDEYWEKDDTFECEDCGERFCLSDRDDRNTGEDLCECCADERADEGDTGNVVPALPAPDTYAELEAAGQLRLPLELAGLHVVDNETGACWPAVIRDQDSSDIPFRIWCEAFETHLAYSGWGMWFKADGTCVTSGQEDRFTARNLPVLPHGGLVTVTDTETGTVYTGCRIVAVDRSDPCPFYIRLEDGGRRDWFGETGHACNHRWFATGLPSCDAAIAAGAEDVSRAVIAA